LALAKTEGYDLTKEEAEAYLDELNDVELEGEELKHVAGGLCYTVTMVCYTIKNSDPNAQATCNTNR
jgi:hypothetical protein